MDIQDTKTEGTQIAAAMGVNNKYASIIELYIKSSTNSKTINALALSSGLQESKTQDAPQNNYRG